MNECPFISIGIASHNYEDLIIRALEAIKRQSFTDYEVLICDDASTDNSVIRIKSFANNNPQIKIRLICNENNKGILYTKNRLVREASGKYIMICDADDWMTDDCLQSLAELARREDSDRVIGEVYDINQNGRILQIQDLPEHPSKWMSTLHHGSLYKRDIFIKNNITFKYMPDDAYVIIKFNQYCSKVSFLKKPVYYWYVHNDSAGRKNKKKSIEWFLSYFENIIKFVSETQICLEAENRFDDVEQVRLLKLKLYYNQILHGMRHLSISHTVQAYNEMQRLIVRNDSHYLKNKYLRNKKVTPLRNYAYRIIKLCTILEKNKVMIPTLIVYKIASKFIYFDQ